MKFALVNPNWSFKGSIYFGGCLKPHLPLEYGYSKALLEREGNDVIIIDGHLENLSLQAIRAKVAAFSPDYTVITTAPTYLFWRCPQPELGVPAKTVSVLKDVAGTTVAVGPHGSVTPGAVLRKLNVDLVILGECEEALAQLSGIPAGSREKLQSACYRKQGEIVIQGLPRVSDMSRLPALRWPKQILQKHRHQHGRFIILPIHGPSKIFLSGLSAEIESSRGCPYQCSFCAKDNFRNGYRRRPLPVVLEEIDDLISKGVKHVYFIDEIFMPDIGLLEAVKKRKIKFGIQTRIDVWEKKELELLGSAGCVSLAAGIENISQEGRLALGKNCPKSTEEISALLGQAKRFIKIVQAALIKSDLDDAKTLEKWRRSLKKEGVWVNKPVPLFPYPGSPIYKKLWGQPDNYAWERAHAYYLKANTEFGGIQEKHPLSLEELEKTS